MRYPNTKFAFSYLVLFTLVICAGRTQAQSQPGGDVTSSVTEEGLVVENQVVRRVVAFEQGDTPGAIEPRSLVHVRSGRDYLAGSNAPAWFEFNLNGQVVSSQDPVWVYRDHTSQEMKHGGLETEVVFEAVSGPAQGLRVHYTLQAYPTSPVFREHIRLEASLEAALTLTHVDGDAHVIFPRYSFSIPDGGFRGREIRIASWNYELMEEPETEPSYDERALESGYRVGANLSQNYMYHPRRIEFAPEPGNGTRFKGPIVMYWSEAESSGLWLAYEHGSPDDSPEQTYVGIDQEVNASALNASVHIFRGAYFDQEPVTTEQPFSALWAEIAVFEGDSFDAGEAVLWDFLYYWINDEPASREPVVYYNTWGMQRDEQNRMRITEGTTINPQNTLTTERILTEIGHADEMEVDMFVLDDGWQNNFGDWLPAPERLSQGLEPIKQELDRRGMLFGIWMAPTYADTFSTVMNQHPEWFVRDENGRRVISRWHKPAVCLESDYYHYIVDVSKRLIDAGVRHFKWDGVDTDVWCSSPDHWHGDASQSPEERRERYGYEFVRTITRLIQELKAYEPEVVIEFDATEPNRSIGLSILSEAKYYWMNNGASWYGDRSRYRVISMRMVPALFHNLIPPVLQNAANYPNDLDHFQAPFRDQRYAVNTSLLGGLGFWGNLAEMSAPERQRAGEIIGAAKRVLPTVAGVRPTLTGSVGSTPEIYTYVDPETATGQIIGFTGAAVTYEHVVSGINTGNLLAVLRNAYTADSSRVVLPFYFLMPFSSREAFLVSNEGNGISITASTSWLKDARITPEGTLTFENGAPGRHEVRWPTALGEPSVQPAGTVRARTNATPDAYMITIQTLQPNTTVTVSPRP